MKRDFRFEMPDFRLELEDFRFKEPSVPHLLSEELNRRISNNRSPNYRSLALTGSISAVEIG
jgi:hypothetical protein